MIANKIANLTTEDNSTNEENTETKWIKLECKPKNFAIGVFYGPQEKTKQELAKSIYNCLETQVSLQMSGNEIILGGDFNAKIEIDNNEIKQKQSRNGKLLQRMIENTGLQAISTKADIGSWTRVNRKNTNEKSIIDYILTTPTIANNKLTMVIDETGELRVNGKNESDHNTMILTTKINIPRKPTFIEPWKVNNEEGWKKFNDEMGKITETKPEITNNYPELEKTITRVLMNTIGKQKIRTDKPGKTKNENTKLGKQQKKSSPKRIPERVHQRK